MKWDDVIIGKKNLIDSGWQKDDSVLCSSCQHAVWGWWNDKYSKYRFVTGCIKTFNERGNHVSITGRVGVGFDPAISCEAYEKIREA